MLRAVILFLLFNSLAVYAPPAQPCPMHIAAASRVLKWFLDPIALQIARWNIRYISPRAWPVTHLGRRIFAQVTEEFSPPLEPFMVHIPSDPLLLGFWLVAYESFASPYLDRAEKEAIATNVSASNKCEFCRIAHAQMGCAALGCISPESPESHATERETERLAVTLVFEYINRMMLVFTRHPNAFMLGTDSIPGKIMGTMVNLRVGPDARRIHEEGLSFTLLQEGGPLPIGNGALFRWAESRPNIERAFRQWHGLMLSIEERLPFRRETKLYLQNLVSNTSSALEYPTEEKDIVYFAKQLIFTPTDLALPSPGGPLRNHFPTDTAWVEFVGWCSYLGAINKLRSLVEIGD
jgi:hypothetical protein